MEAVLRDLAGAVWEQRVSSREWGEERLEGRQLGLVLGALDMVLEALARHPGWTRRLAILHAMTSDVELDPDPAALDAVVAAHPLGEGKGDRWGGGRRNGVG